MIIISYFHFERYVSLFLYFYYYLKFRINNIEKKYEWTLNHAT